MNDDDDIMHSCQGL